MWTVKRLKELIENNNIPDDTPIRAKGYWNPETFRTDSTDCVVEYRKIGEKEEIVVGRLND